MLDLNEAQAAAVPKFVNWYRRFKARDRSVAPGFTILGLAGTGKTALAVHLLQEAGLDLSQVAGGALQAGAALNLQQVTGLDSRTLHSWVYVPDARVGRQVAFKVNPASPLLDYDLLVIDEIQQVSLDLWRDVTSLGIPVLVLGDNGQIGPVAAEGIAGHLAPDAVLSEIHRQEAGDPIASWSMQVRQGVDVPFGEFRNETTGAVTLRKLRANQMSWADYQEADLILVGKHATRMEINRMQRMRLGRMSPFPEIGEPVYCRNKNQHQYGIVNARSGVVIEGGRDAGKHSYTMTFQLDESGVVIPQRRCRKEEIGIPSGACPDFLSRDLSDIAFGYSRTVHSFIGRQANNVILIDEWGSAFRREWLYTGMSRAQKRLTIVSP